MKQFFKILALAALALPFTGCDVEYSDINILPDPVFEQNGLYTVNTISIYDDYETVINVSRTAGLSKELELDIVVDETLLAEYNELYNTDYKLLEAQFYDIPKNAQLASTVKSVDISVRIHPKALIAAKGMAAANNMLLPIRISNASTPVEDGGSMMQALLRLNIVEPIVQVEMPEQMPQLEFIPTIPLPQEITLNATANFNTLEVAKIGYRVNASKVDAYNEEHGITPQQIRKAKNLNVFAGTEGFAEGGTGKEKSPATAPRPYVEQESSTTVAADPIVRYMSRAQLEKSIERTRKLMQEAAKKLDFIEAAQYRDEVLKMEELLKEKTE